MKNKRAELGREVNLERHLAARLGPLAFFLFVVVAISAPLVYLVRGIQTIRARAQSTAKLVAKSIQEEAQQRPVLWRYDAPKLLRSVSLPTEHQSIIVRIDLTDEQGRLIELGQDPPSAEDLELLWYGEPISLDRGLAQVWVGVTTQEVERQGSLIFLGFAVLGAALAGVMYGLPLKALVVAQRRIDVSQRALEDLNINLEATVIERSSQLRAALGEVRDKEQHLRELSGRAVAMQEAERRALSRELHDSAGQALTAIRINLQLLSELAGNEGAKSMATRTVGLADSTLEEIRRVVDRLAPAVLDDLGLQRAIERHCDDFSERTGVEIDYLFEDLDKPGLGTGVETAAYRIVQETLTNVSRHAKAERVDIHVYRSDAGSPNDRIVLDIRDDGVGFDVEVARAKGRRGLEGMRERVELLGGTIEMRSAPGAGVQIHIELPIADSPEPTLT
jgi:signal transduction histidine kinase